MGRSLQFNLVVRVEGNAAALDFRFGLLDVRPDIQVLHNNAMVLKLGARDLQLAGWVVNISRTGKVDIDRAAGINVYRAVYRDGAPTETVAERRRAVIGFAAGSFLLKDLASAAVTSLPGDVTAQLVVAHHTVVGPQGSLEDPSRASIQIATGTLTER